MTEQYHKKWDEYVTIRNAGGEFAEASAIYHTSDIERRALVWQEKIIRRYFPHWSEGIESLLEKVRKLRLEKKGMDVIG